MARDPSDCVDWGAVESSEADSVELKVPLAPRSRPDEILTPRRPSRVRRLHLIDTTEHALSRAGIDIRLRDRGRGRHDLTVRRRRPHEPSTGRAAALPRSRCRVELDVLLPGGIIHTTECRRDVDPALAQACVAAGHPVPGLLSRAQEAFLAAEVTRVVPSLSSLFGRLVVHGPLVVERARLARRRFPLGRAHLERCRLPRGRELYELSVRCAPRSARSCAETLAHLIDDRDIDLAPRGRTKTATWLDDLTHPAPADPA